MKSNYVVIAAGMLLSVFVLGYIVSRSTGYSSGRANKFVVAMMSGWAPFMTINDQGMYEGFDVDVARELASRMGKELEIVDMGSLAPTFIALDQGKVDAVLSGLDITQERCARYAMIPYAGEDIKEFALLFWSKIPQEVSSIDDLKKIADATVCVEPGSSLEKFLDSVKGITQKPLAKIEEMVMDVQYGKSLAMLVEPQIARRLQKMVPEFKAVAVPLSEKFQTFGLGIAVRQNDTKFVNEILAIVGCMKNDGTLKELEQRWQLAGVQ